MNGIKPRLLIFINTLQSGGAERVVSLLLNHLKDDFEIHLALYCNIIDYKIPPEIKLLDLHQPLKQGRLIRLFKIPVKVEVFGASIFTSSSTMMALSLAL